VIQSRQELAGFRDAVPGAEIVVVRLRAKPETLLARVRARGIGSGTQWHLNRAPELAKLMDEERVEDFLIETDDLGLTDVASGVLSSVGWLKSPSSP
jgi:hypothetical protein